MGFLGAIGKAVGHIPGMQTMNKALPGNGMPGVNQQPKPQLGGAMGPSIKPAPVPQQMNQMRPIPQNNPQMEQAGGMARKMMQPVMGNKFGSMMNQMPPWMQQPQGGFTSNPQAQNQGPQESFLPMNRGMGPSPNFMQYMNRGGFTGPQRQIQTMMPQGQMMAGNPNRNMPQ